MRLPSRAPTEQTLGIKEHPNCLNSLRCTPCGAPCIRSQPLQNSSSIKRIVLMACQVPLTPIDSSRVSPSPTQLHSLLLSKRAAPNCVLEGALQWIALPRKRLLCPNGQSKAQS